MKGVDKMLYGGIEAGGTKFVCGIGNEQLQVIERKSFPTTTPEETMKQVFDFFDKYKGNIASIGVGAFGPIDIQIESRTYGYITNTPKLAWQNYHFVGALENALSVPIYWTTDVNAACYGEYMAGYGKGKNNVLYYTVGTGVGGGAVVGGKIVAGFSHPEMGHMLLQRHNEDQFEGICPFHHDCLEGLASGPAIEKRFGRKAQTISFDHPYWAIEADYLAQCVYNTTLLYAPEVIILGGGVMKQPQLLELIRQAFKEKMGSYVDTPVLEEYLLTPMLADDAGLIGCLALAIKKLEQ